MFKKKQNVEALFRTSFCLFMGFSRQEYWSGLPFPSPILWSPDAKNWLIGKDPDAGKDWRQEEKGVTEDETVGWHHQLYGQDVWASSGSWWWSGKTGVLQSMGLQRVGHNWATELYCLEQIWFYHGTLRLIPKRTL